MSCDGPYCEHCGDCVFCYAEDPCVKSPTGKHEAPPAASMCQDAFEALQREVDEAGKDPVAFHRPRGHSVPIENSRTETAK